MGTLDQVQQLASSIASLRSGKYSDFQIRCSDDTIIRTHRAVVCPRSRVLSAAIDGQFQEAVSQEIYLKDDEPDIVAKMVDFLYKLDYEDHRSVDPQQPTEYDPTSLLVNAKVYIIADKYELQHLKVLACTKYKQVLAKTWNTAVFTESVQLVYDNIVETDRMLPDVIVQAASDNAKALLDRGEFVDLLKNHGDLATEIMRKVISRYESPEESQDIFAFME